MAKEKKYYIPEGNYEPTFLKAVAMGIHKEVLEPEELEYWFENGWTQIKMSKELYKRLK